MTPQYPGIRFPDRAENLGEYDAYRVFLEPWDPLATDLRKLYEGLAVRRDTRLLAVYGPQGTGKTLFATKLVGDHEATRRAIHQDSILPDRQNLWHRIVGGRSDTPSNELIRTATERSVVAMIENEQEWVTRAADILTGQTDRHCILVADNAERAYFRQGLVDLSDAEFLALGSSDEAMRMAAQNLVRHCRTTLRGSLIVLLTNDDLFLLNLAEAIEAQHSDLMRIAHLPMPSGTDKELVVRVNTNRLNQISYWYCLDRAGPDHKRAVRDAILGAASFPKTFQAVDEAIRYAPPSRVGRSARKNQISLLVLNDLRVADDIVLDSFAEVEHREFSSEWTKATLFGNGWTKDILSLEREGGLLESEWNLRIVLLGRPFVASLLSGDESQLDHCRCLLDALRTVYGPGTWTATRERLQQDIEATTQRWPSTTQDLSQFWAAGQIRSHQYEAVLRILLPGYDTGDPSFLSYRPDFVVTPFSPASLTSALSSDGRAIAEAIQRKAHVFEVTAMKKPTIQAIRTYLSTKLKNYVEVTQEQ